MSGENHKPQRKNTLPAFGRAVSTRTKKKEEKRSQAARLLDTKEENAKKIGFKNCTHD